MTTFADRILRNMSMTISELIASFKCEGIEEQARFDMESVIEKELKLQYTAQNIKDCIACMDYTTLTPKDTEESVKAFVESLYTKTARLDVKPAAICVFPNYASVVKSGLEESGVATAVVAAGFPASQTFLELKKSECKMAIQAGAEEVDIVIPVGKMLAMQYDEVYQELITLREVCSGVKLKVILETGELNDSELIFKAALIAIHAGADFIKTSTGKVTVNATPEAVYAMALAIKAYYEKFGKKVGIKVAGGVSTTVTAIKYRTIVSHILGEEWITPEYFRIGTSKLLDDAIRSLNAL